LYSKIKDGLPNDAAMIALIEMTAADETSMQKSVDIYADNCGLKIG